MRFLMALFTAVFLLISVNPALAKAEDKAIMAVEEMVQEKMNLSKTLDVFDMDAKKVRNLKTWPDDFTSKKLKKNEFEITARFQDKRTKELVDVVFLVNREGKKYVVGNPKIATVSPKPPKEEVVYKVFETSEVIKILKKLLKDRYEGSGDIVIFDEKKNGIRKLRLESLGENVRHYGKLYIVSANFIDVEAKKNVSTDITLENKGRSLEIQKIRIRKITPRQK